MAILLSKGKYDKMYTESKDQWTKKAADCELFKFYDVITNGKRKFECFTSTVWEN